MGLVSHLKVARQRVSLAANQFDPDHWHQGIDKELIRERKPVAPEANLILLLPGIWVRQLLWLEPVLFPEKPDLALSVVGFRLLSGLGLKDRHRAMNPAIYLE